MACSYKGPILGQGLELDGREVNGNSRRVFYVALSSAATLTLTQQSSKKAAVHIMMNEDLYKTSSCKYAEELLILM